MCRELEMKFVINGQIQIAPDPIHDPFRGIDSVDSTTMQMMYCDHSQNP